MEAIQFGYVYFVVFHRRQCRQSTCCPHYATTRVRPTAAQIQVFQWCMVICKVGCWSNKIKLVQ